MDSVARCDPRCRSCLSNQERHTERMPQRTCRKQRECPPDCIYCFILSLGPVNALQPSQRQIFDTVLKAEAQLETNFT